MPSIYIVTATFDDERISIVHPYHRAYPTLADAQTACSNNPTGIKAHWWSKLVWEQTRSEPDQWSARDDWYLPAIVRYVITRVPLEEPLMPSFYTATRLEYLEFEIETVLPFVEVYRTLDEAKEACAADLVEVEDDYVGEDPSYERSTINWSSQQIYPDLWEGCTGDTSDAVQYLIRHVTLKEFSND